MPTPNFDKPIENLLTQLSTREKIGQLFQEKAECEKT